MASKSKKTKVIEHLFDKYWDEAIGKPTKTLISLDDVVQAIQECNAAKKSSLRTNNPANFMKDFLRGANPSKNWPDSVAKRRYTAEQRTGHGACFEFVPYRADQTEPFPDEFGVRDDAPRHPIQSISIPLVTKTLGREDETWLIQTAVNLRIVETHFAVAAAFPLLELAHLQTGIKLRYAEIDALFLGKVGDEQNPASVLVTCEAKQTKDRLIPSQVIKQVQGAFDLSQVETVVPIGLRRIPNVGFYLTEFEAVKRDSVSKLKELVLVKDVIYELHPPVKGI